LIKAVYKHDSQQADKHAGITYQVSGTWYLYQDDSFEIKYEIDRQKRSRKILYKTRLGGSMDTQQQSSSSSSSSSSSLETVRRQRSRIGSYNPMTRIRPIWPTPANNDAVAIP